MNNFMIGQFGFFDTEKQKRDFRQGFYGMEACLMKSEEEITALLTEQAEQGIQLGIHFPLRAWAHSARDPLYLDLKGETRSQAYQEMENEFEYLRLRGIRPSYILLHFPKPVIIPDYFDLSRWRFYQRSEYVFESEYPLGKFIEYSNTLFEWLTDRSLEHGFLPVLELDALNRYVFEDDFLENLLRKHNRIKLCMDLGRLHIQQGIDPWFDAGTVLKRFLKYTEVLHLWQAKIGTTVEYGHYPLLPGLKPEEGWAKVEEYFKIIRSENKDVRLLFEHRSDLISDEELDSCYGWIDRLMKGE